MKTTHLGSPFARRDSHSRLPDTEAEASLIHQGDLKRIVAGCHRRLGSPLSAADLDEAIQETCVVAWQRRPYFDGRSSLETWVYGIARHRILQLAQRSRTYSNLKDRYADRLDPSQDSLAPPLAAQDTGLSRVLESAVKKCGTTVVQIIRLRAVDDASFVEIADRMKMKEPAVKSRYYRALETLRKTLGRFRA